jgi:hypothetical protein
VPEEKPKMKAQHVAAGIGTASALGAVNASYWKSPKSAFVAPKSRTPKAKTPAVTKLASKAAGRSLGAVGLLVGAPNAIASAAKINKEGGAFAARFGKFVEELTGMPSGSSWRPPTKKEQERDLSI